MNMSKYILVEFILKILSTTKLHKWQLVKKKYLLVKIIIRQYAGKSIHFNYEYNG